MDALRLVFEGISKMRPLFKKSEYTSVRGPPQQPIPVQYETHRATGSGRAIQLGWGHNRKTTGGQSPLRAVYGPTRIPHPLRVDLTRKTRKKRLKQTQSGPAEKIPTGGGRLTDVYSSFSAVYRICERAQRPLSRHRLPREWCTSG